MIKQKKKFLAVAAVVAMSLWGAGEGYAADVLISGQNQVPVDTNGGGPDVGDEYYTTTYDPAGNCYYVQGRVNGLVPNTDHAFTFTADPNGNFTETAGCGPVQNYRDPAMRLNGILSSNAGDGAACNSLPGGNGDSSGMLVDTNGDGTYDSVCGTQTSGAPVVLTDISNFLYTPPTAANPTHFWIPARLRMSFAPSSNYYPVYVPLEAGGVRASAVVQGLGEVGSFDLTNGVTIGGNRFNVFTILGQGMTQSVPTITPFGLVVLMLGLLMATVFGMRRIHPS